MSMMKNLRFQFLPEGNKPPKYFKSEAEAVTHWISVGKVGMIFPLSRNGCRENYTMPEAYILIGYMGHWQNTGAGWISLPMFLGKDDPMQSEHDTFHVDYPVYEYRQHGIDTSKIGVPLPHPGS